MRSAMVPAWLVAACSMAVLATAATAETKQIPVVRIHSTAELAAAPSAVWQQLTTGKNLVTWCPEWKSARNATTSIAKVGDVLDYTDSWGNAGRSIVTFLVRDKELRVAHEPNDGSYLCQVKFVLTPTAKGTKIDLWEQYTDESSETDRRATSGKMEAEHAKTLAALRQGVEKK